MDLQSFVVKNNLPIIDTALEYACYIGQTKRQSLTNAMVAILLGNYAELPSGEIGVLSNFVGNYQGNINVFIVTNESGNKILPLHELAVINATTGEILINY